MKTPLISIVMPVYNAALYLDECLQSILDQSYKNWELIAVNDFSEDDSEEILSRWCEKDQRITRLKNSKKGIIEALQLAYSQSTGELITRMDADDLMHRSKLEKMSKALMKSGEKHLAVCSVHYFKQKGPIGDGYKRYAEWLNKLTAASNNFDEIYKECVIPSPGWMCFRADFDALGAFESDRYPEDYDLAFRFRNAGLKILGVNTVLHFWRDHDERASRNDPNYTDNRFIDLKTQMFMEHDLDRSRTLILWGAGKKGKDIAKLLLNEGVAFDWITETPQKQGVNIYGKVLKGPSHIDFKQIIVAVAGDAMQKDIQRTLSGLRAAEVFFFC